MFSLNDTDEVLRPHCTKLLKSLGHSNTNAAAALLGGPYSSLPRGASLMDQCLVEQRYVRGAQLRTLIYNQVTWFVSNTRQECCVCICAVGCCWSQQCKDVPGCDMNAHTLPSCRAGVNQWPSAGVCGAHRQPLILRRCWCPDLRGLCWRSGKRRCVDAMPHVNVKPGG